MTHFTYSTVYYANGNIRHWQYPKEFIDDQNLGRRHRPSAQVRHIQRTEKKLIFEAIYSFEQFGRGYPEVTNPEKRSKFMILYGCSYTYGNGFHKQIPQASGIFIYVYIDAHID